VSHPGDTPTSFALVGLLRPESYLTTARHQSGVNLVWIYDYIFQLGIGKGRQNEGEFKKKVEKIIAKVDIPVQILIAKDADIYRKPAPGMWNYLSERVSGLPVCL
jgi:DNA 3'-phosphatase